MACNKPQQEMQWLHPLRLTSSWLLLESRSFKGCPSGPRLVDGMTAGCKVREQKAMEVAKTMVRELIAEGTKQTRHQGHA